MHVEAKPPEMLPVPEGFPVEWENPEDQRLSFMLAQDHFPRPITPLDFDFFREVGEQSVAAVAEHYDGPLRYWRMLRINTYAYQANVPVECSPEEELARARRSEQKIRSSMGRLRERWEQETLPEVKSRLAWFDAFDLKGASMDQLLAHFSAGWRCGVELWRLHFMEILPAYIALSEFDELYRQLFGESGALDTFKVLQGLPTTTTAVAERLWALSRQAIHHPDVREALERDGTAETLSSLEGSETGRAFLTDLRSFLEEYGKRTETWVLSSPSWIEDPSLVLKNIRELLARQDSDAPTITTTRAIEERERQLSSIRGQLEGYPEPVRTEFEALMESARWATVIQDDHNFWIDFCTAYRLRRVALEVGRRLAQAGVIDAAGDVFMLTREELDGTAANLPDGDRRELVEARREEMERWVEVTPPRALGSTQTAIPTDTAVYRFMAKFYGVPPTPSERPDEVRGLPGAGGKARGVARLIRSIAELDRLKPGEVLVTETTAPPWTPVFSTAAAVVTDSGGVLCHAAVVAREYGIPAVVGTALATTAIADGALVEVDGSAGLVRILEPSANSIPDGDGRGVAAPAHKPAPAESNGAASTVPIITPDDTPRYVHELQVRNEEILTPSEQGMLGALCVLVAGCGSVGGSVVEPLVRLGVGELILADPDAFELNNINRQACTAADVGRPKAEVLAERARAINPLIKVSTLRDGITAENVVDAVGRAGIVFDGIDPSPGPLQTKYLMHQFAARDRIPVLTGADLGGKPTLFVWDYRRDNRPFYGRANVSAFREGRLFEALVPIIGLRNVPSDFLPVVLGRAAKRPSPTTDQRLMDKLGWPQVSYCTAALGALATRTIVSVMEGREVPHVVTADLHMLTRTQRERATELVRRPLVLARTVRTLQRMRSAAQAPAPIQPASADSLAGVSASIVPVLEAMRLAPSAHNTQPWRFVALGPDRIRLEHDPTRCLQIADPDGRQLCHSLGCAVEAANSVAQIDWEPSDGLDPLAAGWYPGELISRGVRDADYRSASGLLAARGTDRGPYGTQRLGKDVLARFEDIGERFGVPVYTVSSLASIRNFTKVTGTAAMAHFTHGPFLDEILSWIRFSDRERDWDADGFTPEALGLTPFASRLLRQLKANPGLRQASLKVYLPALMGRMTTGVVRHSAALVLLATRTRSPQTWIAAGRAMMAIWLEATREDLTLQPVGYPIELPELRPVVGTIFGAALSDQPVLALRIGRRINPTPGTPRLPLRRLLRPPEIG